MGRAFYACAGPADLLLAHRYWREGTDFPDEVALTFSGLIEEFCRKNDLALTMVSPRGPRLVETDGTTRIEHWARKPRGGIAYIAGQLFDGLRIVLRAVANRSTLVIVDQGCAMDVAFLPLRLAGIPVVSIMHNTLWPAHHRSRSAKNRALFWLNGWFWRYGPAGVIGMSEECLRQVAALAPRAAYPMVPALAMFRRDYFTGIGAPPPLDGQPFSMLFVGRAERSKGLFDLADMAAIVEEKHPGRVHWVVCGDGSDLPAFRAMVAERGLAHVFDIAGWTRPDALVERYRQCHAAIVPTRSAFAEGMAMTGLQAACAGRPLIASEVVPAGEFLGDAALVVPADDPAAAAEAVIRLATDKALYERLCGLCKPAAEPVFDPANGLDAALQKVFDALPAGKR